MYGSGLKGNLAKMRSGIARGWFPAPPKGLPELKSMVHVDDCARVLVHLRTIVAKGVEIFYLSDGRKYSPYDIVQMLQARTDKSRRAIIKSTQVAKSAEDQY